jgi:hypothetical protein
MLSATLARVGQPSLDEWLALPPQTFTEYMSGVPVSAMPRAGPARARMCAGRILFALVLRAMDAASPAAQRAHAVLSERVPRQLHIAMLAVVFADDNAPPRLRLRAVAALLRVCGPGPPPSSSALQLLLSQFGSPCVPLRAAAIEAFGALAARVLAVPACGVHLLHRDVAMAVRRLWDVHGAVRVAAARAVALLLRGACAQGADSLRLVLVDSDCDAALAPPQLHAQPPPGEPLARVLSRCLAQRAADPTATMRREALAAVAGALQLLCSESVSMGASAATADSGAEAIVAELEASAGDASAGDATDEIAVTEGALEQGLEPPSHRPFAFARSLLPPDLLTAGLPVASVCLPLCHDLADAVMPCLSDMHEAARYEAFGILRQWAALWTACTGAQRVCGTHATVLRFVLDMLMERTLSPRFHVRREAVWHLQALLPSLQHVLHDGGADGSIGSVWARLQQLTRDPHEAVRCSALGCLHALRRETACEAILQRLQHDSELVVRLYAAKLAGA